MPPRSKAVTMSVEASRWPPSVEASAVVEAPGEDIEGLARSLEQERCADALVAAKAEAAAHLAQHVHHAEDVVAMETTESFFSSSTMTPSMGAQRAAWTNTATDAMSPRTRAFIKAR